MSTLLLQLSLTNRETVECARPAMERSFAGYPTAISLPGPLLHRHLPRPLLLLHLRTISLIFHVEMQTALACMVAVLDGLAPRYDRGQSCL
ncbi:hypothetical protein BKA59DRAFT_462075 [Fusarium tricinctum]|uniref:Uncharacterized protein n=1 Tax=Fusarium tricinctum TaxID=61284 RepID=A0A8K0SC19_9HYPO|nr:hypothetical protein BKA59DRAFT_462075 [Fusarium tricinctum]